MPDLKLNGWKIPWAFVIQFIIATFYAGGIWFKLDALEKKVYTDVRTRAESDEIVKRLDAALESHNVRLMRLENGRATK